MSRKEIIRYLLTLKRLLVISGYNYAYLKKEHYVSFDREGLDEELECVWLELGRGKNEA